MIRIALALPLAAALMAAPLTASASPTSINALHTAQMVQLRSSTANDASETPGHTRVMVEVETAPPPTTIAPPAYVPTTADRYASQARADRKSARGLLASGIIVAGASYLFTSLGGALTIDKARKRTDDPFTEEDEARGARRQRAYGQALMIPGVGPLLAIHRADRAVRGWAAGVAGLGQAVGLGLTIAGIHRLSRSRRLERLSVAAMATGREASVTLGVRF